MYPQCACFGGCIITLAAFVGLFPTTVSFQMYPQVTCIKGCKVALVAFVWLFPSVSFQMPRQIACPNWCIITQVAFLRLFSTMYFQMCLQNTCIGRCIFTLAAFVLLFFIVCFQMSPQIASLRWRIVASIALVWHCVLVISCFIVRSFFIEIVSSGLKMLKVFIRHTCCWLEQVRGKGRHLTATLLSEHWPFVLMTNLTLCLRLKGKVNFYKLYSNPTKLTILSLRLKLVSSIRGCSHMFT